LPWRHLPARYAIFVAQLGRKFRPFSLTMQRYEILIAVYESFAKNFRFFSDVLNWLTHLLQRCSVAVLERVSLYPQKYSIYIFIYINIYIDLNFNFEQSILELQHCNAATQMCQNCVLRPFCVNLPKSFLGYNLFSYLCTRLYKIEIIKWHLGIRKDAGIAFLELSLRRWIKPLCIGRTRVRRCRRAT